MKQVIFFLIFFTVFSQAGLSLAQSPPLLHARLKIEGIHKKSSILEIHEALLSVSGVKKVDFEISKRWFLFRDYKNTQVIVEFEHGTLTSETLILAVERVGKPNNIYKVKFIE